MWYVSSSLKHLICERLHLQSKSPAYFLCHLASGIQLYQAYTTTRQLPSSHMIFCMQILVVMHASHTLGSHWRWLKWLVTFQFASYHQTNIFCHGQSIISQFDTLCAILWYAGLHVVILLLKIVKLWHLSIEFYGEWQLFATHHRTQY